MLSFRPGNEFATSLTGFHFNHISQSVPGHWGLEGKDENQRLIGILITYPPLFTGGDWGGLESNPFEVLMPCESLFNKFGFKTPEIPIAAILEKLQDRLEVP